MKRVFRSVLLWSYEYRLRFARKMELTGGQPQTDALSASDRPRQSKEQSVLASRFRVENNLSDGMSSRDFIEEAKTRAWPRIRRSRSRLFTVQQMAIERASRVAR